MAMGQSEAKKITVNGREVTDRTPAKKLNPFVKAKLLAILERKDIFITQDVRAGDNTYTVHNKDAKGPVFFVVLNAWDYGYYSISINNTIVAEMDWYENDGNTNKDQKDIFDVLEATHKKLQGQSYISEAEKQLTKQEMAALEYLKTIQK